MAGWPIDLTTASARWDLIDWLLQPALINSWPLLQLVQAAKIVPENPRRISTTNSSVSSSRSIFSPTTTRSMSEWLTKSRRASLSVKALKTQKPLPSPSLRASCHNLSPSRYKIFMTKLL